MFYEEIRTKQILTYINLLIKYSVQEQIHFNGKAFGNKCCRCNGGSLYCVFCHMIYFLQIDQFASIGNAYAHLHQRIVLKMERYLEQLYTFWKTQPLVPWNQIKTSIMPIMFSE